MSELLETLIDYGFTKQEAIVYILTQNHGPIHTQQLLSISPLSTEETDIALTTLLDQGYLIISSPETYTAVTLEELIKKGDRVCAQFSMLLPDFEQIIKKYNNLPKVSYYQGVSGLKKYYNKQLIAGNDIYAFLGTQQLHPELAEYLYNQHVPKRVAKGIHAKVIVSADQANHTYKSLDSTSLRETVMINHPLLELTSEIDLFGECSVGFALFTEDELSATIIQSKKLYTTLKSVFDLLWITYDQKHA